jgi:hypothetical protein
MRKRHLIYLLLSLLTTFIIPGCEKVINVDLNDAAPRIVIEGLVTDRRGPYTVTLTKSGSYFNQPTLETVSGAKAVISDDFGNIDSLHESLPGTYNTTRLRGVTGRTYTLLVISEDQEYTGTSTMMSRVNIDSLILVKSDYFRFDLAGHTSTETHFDIHCFFRDPPEKNFYRIKVFKNDSINTESYRLYDDQYTNGEEIDLRAARATLGDTFRIELMSLDKPTYGYYRTLADLIYQNPFFGSTPANPNTNLSNGALGYFGASSVSTRTIVITDKLINSVH